MALPTLEPPIFARPHEGHIYHYTSARGLVGLVTSGVLWASEAASLNDSTEVRHGYGMISQQLERANPSQGIDLLKKIPHVTRNAPHEVFIFSATTMSDDASQWDRYADGGWGYCVELDPEKKLVVRSPQSGDESWVPGGTGPGGIIDIDFGSIVNISRWVPVVYVEEEFSAAFGELVSRATVWVDWVKDADDEEDHILRSQMAVGDLAHITGVLAHILKPKSFSGEREVRTVVTALLPEVHLLYRAARFGICSYFELTQAPKEFRPEVLRKSRGDEWEFKSEVPLVQVQLGPMLEEGNKPSVDRFLKRQGYRGVRVVGPQRGLRT